MNKDEITDALKEILIEHNPILEEDTITPDSLLLFDLSFEQLDLLEIFGKCETTFNVKFPPEGQTGSLKTVDDVVEYIYDLQPVL